MERSRYEAAGLGYCRRGGRWDGWLRRGPQRSLTVFHAPTDLNLKQAFVSRAQYPTGIAPDVPPMHYGKPFGALPFGYCTLREIFPSRIRGLSLRGPARHTNCRLDTPAILRSSTSQRSDLKIYGYSVDGHAPEQVVPSEVAEITLVATPDELRRIAKFLELCANGIDCRGTSWEHEHLSDRDRSFEGLPQLVVFNSERAQ